MNYTRKLEHLRVSSLPKVVKNTLNSVAFFAKKTTIEKEYKKKGFTNRRGNFIKFATGVDTVKSNKIESMRSGIAIRDKNIAATDEMAQQEIGGKLNRSLIAAPNARTSRSWDKQVKKVNRIGSIPNRVFGERIKAGRSKKFIAAQARALKNGTNYVAYDRFIFKVTGRKGKIEFKNEIVYSFVEGRKVNIKARHLIEYTGASAVKNMNKIFINHAKYELGR